MSERKINLEEILNEEYNLNKDEDGNGIYYKWEIIKAMKEACRQTLELAAENAKVSIDRINYGCILTEFNKSSVCEINKQSIIDTINQIE